MGRAAAVAVFALLAGLVAVAPASAQELPVGRFAGSDRYDTAIRMSQEFWPTGAASVVLARGDVFADALAGGPLADIAGAPILLTSGNRLDPRVLAEIDRLGAQNVYLLGGTSALSSAVEDAVPAELNTRRFGGANRYQTAEIVDDVISASADLPASAVVASGENYPDAVMASTLLPPRILLSRPDTFTSYDPAYSYTLVGGTSVLSEAIARQTGGVRLAGSNRYATAAEVLEAAARERGPGPLFVATGGDAPDALAAGGAVGRTNGYLLIVDPALGPTDVQATVLRTHATDFDALWALGGTNAVSDDVMQQVVAAIGGSGNGDPAELMQLTPVECELVAGDGVVDCPAHEMPPGELEVTFATSAGDAFAAVFEDACDVDGALIDLSEEPNAPVTVTLEAGQYCVITAFVDEDSEDALFTEVTVAAEALG